MEYARIEMVLVRGGWSRSTVFPGALSGHVRGVVMDPTRLVVTHTIVASKVVRNLAPAHRGPSESASAPDDASRTLELSPRTNVVAAKTTLGRVSRIWVDRNSAKLTHVLVRAAGGMGRAPVEYVIDINRVASLSARTLTLHSGTEALLFLPIYRPDADIADD